MSSAVCARRNQRSQVRPSWPSIMMPTFMAVPPWLDTLPYPRPNGAGMSRAAAPRLLLLVPTTTYRTEDFVEAARRLDVDLVVAAEKPNTLAAALPDHLLTLPFDDPTAAAALMRRPPCGPHETSRRCARRWRAPEFPSLASWWPRSLTIRGWRPRACATPVC